MARFSFKSAVTVAVATSFLVITPVFQPSFAEGGGATLRLLPCFAELPGGYTLVATGFAVQTPGGNINYRCHGEIDPPPPDTIVLNDLPCHGELGDGRAQLVATASGEARFTCQIHPSAE